MEGSESDSVALSNSIGEEHHLGAPSSPVALPEPSDLNHVAQEEEPLAEELQGKLDLKGGDESEEKVSNFNDGGGVYDDETGKGDGDSRGWECNSWNEEVGVDVDINEEVGVDVDVNDDGVDVDINDDGVDVDGDGDGDDGMEKKEERNSGVTQHYPLRPEAEDCAYYMKTGSCKFGFNCKFNHPIRRKNQAVKEKVGEIEEPTERSSMTECKYYQRSGGCKFGKACKYNHPRGKISTAPVLELNFLGLPIRLGERECPYYMRTGSCKFGANCKFNHPDPTAAGGGDLSSGYGNGGSISLQGVSQPSIPSWSSSRTLNEASPFVPLMLSPTQGDYTQSSDWNGYQAPVYLPERSVRQSSTFVMNNTAIDTNFYMHHQKQMPGEEFPERPGEPECSYFLKTGDCKFKSNCKFHHPKNRIARLPPCNLSDKGLPLRPDQSVCSHYSRYGICKFGPACKFDHPINLQPLMMPGLDQQSYSNSASVEVAGIGGSAGATDVTIQQSV